MSSVLIGALQLAAAGRSRCQLQVSSVATWKLPGSYSQAHSCTRARADTRVHVHAHEFMMAASPDRSLHDVYDERGFVFVVLACARCQTLDHSDACMRFRLLNMGSFSELVRGVRRTDGEHVALKIYSKLGHNPDVLARARTESTLLVRLSHPNITRLIEVFDTPLETVVVFELLGGGTLQTRLGRVGQLSEDTTRLVLRQLGAALAYIHDQRVVHRDVTAEHVIFEAQGIDEGVKLTGFSTACVLPEGGSDSSLTEPCGKAGYMAPELSVDPPRYGRPMDVWSLGALAYLCLCGFAPLVELSAVRFSCEFPSPYWDRVSPQARAWVAALLVRDPERRPTAREVLDLGYLAPLPGEVAAARPDVAAFARKLAKAAIATLFISELARRSQPQLGADDV